MIVKTLIAALALGMIALIGPADDTVKLDGVKCVVMPKNGVKAEKVVDYKDAKLFFCCDRCVAGFKADNAKFAVKANQQLALTGQYTQKACPMTGKAVADGKTADVGGVSVGFCCDGCKGKVEKAEGADAKANLVFTDDAFGKGFEKKAAKK